MKRLDLHLCITEKKYRSLSVFSFVNFAHEEDNKKGGFNESDRGGESIFSKCFTLKQTETIQDHTIRSK